LAKLIEKGLKLTPADRLMLADELLSSIEELDGSDTKCTVQDPLWILISPCNQDPLAGEVSATKGIQCMVTRFSDVRARVRRPCHFDECVVGLVVPNIQPEDLSACLGKCLDDIRGL